MLFCIPNVIMLCCTFIMHRHYVLHCVIIILVFRIWFFSRIDIWHIVSHHPIPVPALASAPSLSWETLLGCNHGRQKNLNTFNSLIENTCLRMGLSEVYCKRFVDKEKAFYILGQHFFLFRSYSSFVVPSNANALNSTLG